MDRQLSLLNVSNTLCVGFSFEKGGYLKEILNEIDVTGQKSTLISWGYIPLETRNLHFAFFD